MISAAYSDKLVLLCTIFSYKNTT